MRHRFAALVALAACALALSPVTAAAQSTCSPMFTKVINAFGARSSANSTLPINIDECVDNPITIDITFTGLSSSDGTLSVWEGTNCNDSAARIGASKTCDFVTDMSIPTAGTGTLSITMEDLMCDIGIDEPRTLFFLPMLNSDANTEVTNCDTLTINIDTVAPDAPTNVEGGSGETSIGVTWTATGDDIDEFFVYYDRSDTTCMSPRLVEGEQLETTGLGVVRASKGDRRADVVGAVDVGESAAVGVVAVDTAGNHSLLSNVGCVTGIETTSWLELHRAQGGKTDSTCSVASVGNVRGALLTPWLMLLTLLALRTARRVS